MTCFTVGLTVFADMKYEEFEHKFLMPEAPQARFMMILLMFDKISDFLIFSLCSNVRLLVPYLYLLMIMYYQTLLIGGMKVL